MSIIDGKTSITGLIGYPVSHSLSPLIHNTLFREYNLNSVYIPFPVKPEELHSAFYGLKALGIKGYNVTIPYKEEIVSLVDEIDSGAKYVGALNTILIKDDKTFGYNTDISGFISSLKDNDIDVKGKKALILGAGGSARAILVALALEGIDSIVLVNRTFSKAEKMATDFQEKISCKISPIEFIKEEYHEKVIDSDIIINTTSLGMSGMPDISPISTESLHKEQVIVDIIYNPPETTFLKDAKNKGCKVINGLPMLINQALHSFEIWNDLKPSKDIIYSLFGKNFK